MWYAKENQNHNKIKYHIPVTGFPLASVTGADWTCWVTGLPLASNNKWNCICYLKFFLFFECLMIKKIIIIRKVKCHIPVTGFPLASVTGTDWTCWVTGLPLASI